MSNPTVIPRPLECVFLDAGNTLLSPWPSFEGRLVAVAAQHGVSIEEAEAEAVIMAADREAIWPTDWTDPATQREFWYGFYTQVLERLGHDGDRQELAGALYRTFTDPASYRLFEDCRPALEALVARGLKLGIISNFEPWLEEILRLEGVLELFSALAISGVLGVAKPQPAIFHAALDEAGVAPEAAIHVGDHPDVDGAAARAVGIAPVLIDRFKRLPPEAGPRIRSLAELVELVDAEA
jgi:putative hydrolase of the HAD superfamily